MDATLIKNVWEKRRNLVEELRSVDTEAGAEPTAEQRAKIDRLEAAILETDEKIKTGLESLEAEKRALEAMAEFRDLHRQGSDDTPKGALAEQIAAEKRAVDAFLRGESRSVEFLPPTAEARALNKAGATLGQTLVPTTMYDRIVVSLRDLSTVMAAGATVRQTGSGEDITVPVSNGWSAASIVAEQGSIGISEPTFGSSITLRAYKYGFLAQASPELLADSAFDAEEYLAGQGGNALATGTGAHFVAGTGTGQPNGIIRGTIGRTTVATNAVTGDELIDAFHSLLRPYRASAVWLFNDSTVAAIRKIKDSTNQYLWQPGLAPGQPDTLLGRPVLTDPAVPALGTGNRFGVIADMRRAYVVRLAGGVRVERSDDFAFQTDLITWKFILRADGNIVDTAAVRVLANA